MKKVFINGTFDILHPGHLKLFKVAKELGDYVVVAIDSDRRVKELKGTTRPVNSQSARAEMLRALRFVNEVYIFDSEEELTTIIDECAPQYMVKGSDYANKPIIGRELVPTIVFVDLTDDSTTKIIQSITNR